MTTVLVTGSRDFEDEVVIDAYLTLVAKLHPAPFTLVQGGARGADTLAFAWASKHGWKVVTVPAQWQASGPAAGPFRNSQMIENYQPHVGVCFRRNMSSGSSDCLRKMYAYQKAKNSRLKSVLVADSFN